MGRGLRTVLTVLLAVLVVGSASWAMAAARSPPPDRTIGDPVVVTPVPARTPTPAPTSSTPRATPSPAAVEPAEPRDPDDDETDDPDDDATPEPDDDRGRHRGGDDD